MSCKLGDKCDNVFACNILRPNVELLGCNFYKPKKPMTNEEYLKSCTTEQLAEWLSEKLDYCQIMWYWACDKCTWSKKHESCMNDKEKWVEWLKQPHNG